VHDVRRVHVNDYIRRAMGAPFTARVFRTWGGTLLLAQALAAADATSARPHAVPGATARRAAVAAALRATAARLGNTVAVCKRAYVHPGVLRAFARGRTVSATSSRPDATIARGRAGLDPAERDLLTLLRRERATRS
jgi:DNA topoisomerase-1